MQNMGMNPQQILSKIKEDMIEAWSSYKPTDYSKPKLFKEEATNFRNKLIADAIVKGYTIRTPKLPRKLKKYYKKHGILPLDIQVTQSVQCIEMTLQI